MATENLLTYIFLDDWSTIDLLCVYNVLAMIDKKKEVLKKQILAGQYRAVLGL